MNGCVLGYILLRKRRCFRDTACFGGGEELRIVPGVRSLEDDAGFQDAIAKSETIVFLKAGRTMSRLKAFARNLEEDGNDKPAVLAVSECGTPEQVLYHSLDELPDDSGYMTTVIVRKPLSD